MTTIERERACAPETTVRDSTNQAAGGRRRVAVAWLLAALCIGASGVVGEAADPGSASSASRGRKVLEERRCLSCHSIANRGAGTAADLDRRSITSEHSPAELAALMWNHGPSMWDRMSGEGIAIEPMSEKQADDVLVYFWSLRYFDPRGEAIRGRAVFADKRCDTCHSLNKDRAADAAPSVAEWEGLSDPVVWAQQLWSHSGEMERAMNQRGMTWPEFSEQEMVDLLVYLQNQPATRNEPRRLVLSPSADAMAMFDAKACGTCHSLGSGPTDKESLLGSRHDFNTITGFTAAMWNHAPRIAESNSNEITVEEMGELMSLVYHRGGFEERGNPSKGRSLFAKKGCQSCHGDRGVNDRAIGRAGDRFSAASMVSAVWSHGPEMLDAMRESGRDWPTLSGREVADLVAYLDQERSAGP